MFSISPFFPNLFRLPDSGQPAMSIHWYRFGTTTVHILSPFHARAAERCLAPRHQNARLLVCLSYKSQMWNTIASELNIPWKAVEDMHWELGRERMASLAGGRTLHSGRASDDPASDASPTPSGFPPGTPLTPRLTFVATPSSAFSGPLRPPEGRLAGPPAPVTTNGMPMSRPIPGVEGTGFTSLRSDLSDYRPGGSRGPLPSLAEFERGTPAYAAPGVRQYRDEGGEEDESDDGSDDKE